MAQLDPLIGQQLSNYRITEPLASGGFGLVYKGTHLYLQQRIVAIKLMRGSLNNMEHQQFLHEAEVLESLNHPHILRLLDVGLFNGLPYLVMPFAPGGSLRHRLTGPLPIDQALSIITQIGEALHYAHQHRIIHRDLKPENILFTHDDQPLLADFGIASLISSHSFTTTAIIGTPSYMAPEQFRGQVSPHSDQYALACILYELLTGRRPFHAFDFFALGFMHLNDPPHPPRTLNLSIPLSLEAALLKALAKDRHDRFDTLPAFLAALQPSSPTILAPSSLAHTLPALPLSTKDFFDQAEQFRKARQYQKAIIAYDEVIKRSTNYVNAWNNKGYALNELGRYQEGLAACEEALKRDPNHVNAWNNKGWALNELERYQEGLAACEEALKRDPNHVNAWNNKGYALNRLERYREP